MILDCFGTEAQPIEFINQYVKDTASLSHLHENLVKISDETCAALKPVFDREFPAPDHAVPLVKI